MKTQAVVHLLNWSKPAVSASSCPSIIENIAENCVETHLVYLLSKKKVCQKLFCETHCFGDVQIFSFSALIYSLLPETGHVGTCLFKQKGWGHMREGIQVCVCYVYALVLHVHTHMHKYMWKQVCGCERTCMCVHVCVRESPTILIRINHIWGGGSKNKIQTKHHRGETCNTAIVSLRIVLKLLYFRIYPAV